MNQLAVQAVVHVVDDDESLRSSLRRLLDIAGYSVESYGSAGEFALRHQSSTRGCILLDIRMPGPSGFELHEALARGGNPLPVIFLTGHGDIPMTVRAMKAGAVDFLPKPVRRTELLAAIETALSRDAETMELRSQICDLSKKRCRLTSKEEEVLGWVVQGHPNKNISAEMGIAERTVKAHRAEVMRKLEVNSLAELVKIFVFCERHGIASQRGE